MSGVENVTGSGSSHQRGRVGRRTYVAMLTLILTVNLLDRQILAILAEPIRLELGLSDFQLGILNGLAFATVYAALTLPIARLADSRDRITILAACTTIWSLMCGACGLAANFAQLCAARMGVAAGEAGTGPAAHSLISDLFEPDRRGQAIAFFQLGAPFGILLAFGVGGPLAQAIGWRWTFFVLAVPGIIVALLARVILRDPRIRPPIGKEAVRTPFLRDVRIVLAEPGIRRLILAGALTGTAVFGMVVWVPVLFQRQFGWSVGEAGITFGAMLGLLGITGTILGGKLGDRLQQRRNDGYVLLVGLSMLVSSVPLAAALLIGSAPIALVLLVVPLTGLAMYQGPLAAAMQNTAPPQHRAMASAMLVMAINFVGLGFGPTAIGGLSDLLAKAGFANSLAYALLLAPLAAALCGVILLRSCHRKASRPASTLN